MKYSKIQMGKKQKIMNRSLTIMIIIVLCSSIYSCSKKCDFNQYVIEELSKDISDTLEMRRSDVISNIEVLINGYIDGKAIIKFENGAGRFKEINLKDSFNETYITEWYDTKFHFVYKPISDIKGGSLVLKYRFY